MSVDRYLGFTYNKNTFNCAHFVAMVWKDLTGLDISQNITGFTGLVKDRRAILSDLRVFKRIPSLQSPCMVLLTPTRGEPHIGVYLRGKLLHIKESGVSFDHMEVASRGFAAMRYYTCHKP